MRKALLALGMIVAVAAASLWLVRPSSDATRLEQSERTSTSREIGSVGSAIGDSTGEAAPVAIPQATKSAAQLESLADIEAAFDSEKRDREWAAASENALYDWISQIGGMVLVSYSVECKTTLCKADLVSPRGINPQIFPSYFRNLVGRNPEHLKQHTSLEVTGYSGSVNPRELPRYTIYLMDDAPELPKVFYRLTSASGETIEE